MTCTVSSSAYIYNRHTEGGEMATGGVDAMISADTVEMKVGKSSHDCHTKIKTRFKNSKKINMIHKLDEEQVSR